MARAHEKAQSAVRAGRAKAFGVILSIYAAATLTFMIYANNIHLAMPLSAAATIDWGQPAVRGDIVTDVMKATPQDDTGMSDTEQNGRR